MSKFPNQTEKTAKSISEAVALALAEMNASEDEVDIVTVEEGSKGFLGIGAKDAKVRVTIKEPQIKAAKDFLADIFSAMKLDAKTDISLNDNNMDIELSGENMGIIIGKHGDTLDSLQYLTSLIVNHDSEEYIKVNMDTENYREKRTEVLVSLSNRLAENVVKNGKKKTLEPMNPYERRIIHSTLQSNTNVTTYSIGDEPYRKVVIAPKNAKPYYKKSYSKDRPYKKNYNKRPDYSSSAEDTDNNGSGLPDFSSDE
ncbi:MAG: protein jag [Oscillospiraceae bacterium]|nr:protein jag [Oscillospiraceae bacterium]